MERADGHPRALQKINIKMYKVGFNTLVWSAVVSDAQFPIIDRLREIGYDGVECFIGAPDDAAYKRFGDHEIGRAHV